MASGFRVQTVAIEGFKGFTKQKELDLKDRHLFLLGQNGNGKSSIIEAVRWGLFGSAGRPNEVVANQNYAGDCLVLITLVREGKNWNLRRRLNRGTTGGTDAELTDEYGDEHSIREVMPQLDSVNAGEGMHIIFAPQSSPLRRQPEDLTPFERTVFNYLGLTHPRALLSHIDDFLESQQSDEDDLSAELTKARTEIDTQISDTTRRVRSIVSSPPWGDGRAPSVTESQNKARALIEEITGSPPDQSLHGVSLYALIESAQTALEEKRVQDQSGLEKEATEVATRKKHVENLRDIRKSIEDNQSNTQSIQSQLDAALSEETLDEVKESVAVARREADAEVLKRKMMEDALQLLNLDQTESISCPICESQHNRQDLELAIQNATHQQDDGVASKLTALESRLQKSQSLEQSVRETKDKLVSSRKRADQANALLDTKDREYLEQTGDIEALIEMLSDQESSIREQIDDREGWFDTKRAQLGKLREEDRFHQIQNTLRDLQARKNRFNEVQAAYDNFVSFGESVRKIQQVISNCLNERLAEEIPVVSDNLSRVFAALTRHPWYDRLVISEDTLPKLELRVASSQDSFGRENPTGVLNGQAESALDLVPYFAFSQSDDTPTEVYLVMLDDPTRAFDDEHIDILVERLADLGRHVQLIVASQETARFHALLPEKFEPGSYVIIEPTGWTHDAGPELKIEYK